MTELTEKRCSWCKETKPVKEFYKNAQLSSGYHSWCKSCCKMKNNERYDRVQWREYYLNDKERYDQYQWDYYEKNREKVAKRASAYNRKHRERIAENCRIWQDNNREAVRAHNQVCNATKRGELVKPDKCECCGGSGFIEFHHPEDKYDSPLQGVWLRRSCHRRLHNGHTDIEIRVNVIYGEKYG